MHIYYLSIDVQIYRLQAEFVQRHQSKNPRNSMSLQQTTDQLKDILSSLSSTSESFKAQASECETVYQSKDEIKKMLYAPRANPTLQDNQKKGVENLALFKDNIVKVSEIFLRLWELQDASLSKEAARLDSINQVRDR